MARVPVSNYVREERDLSGRVVPGVSMYLYTRGTTTPITVYDAQTAGSTVSQPLTSDAEGSYAGKWIDEGSYDAYRATDDVNPTFPIEAFAARGTELGYSEITSQFSTTSTTEVDVTGLSSTVTVGSRPIRVIFDTGAIRNNTANGAVLIWIKEGATTLTTCKLQANPAGLYVPCQRAVRLAPSAGAHTYKVMLSCLSGQAFIECASITPAYIQVIEV